MKNLIDNSVIQTKQTQTAITPMMAVELLKEGNKRFVENRVVERNLLDQVQKTATGQYPFAVILSCIDSRVPAELIFDQGIGDIFNVRIAGNFVNSDILGSLEFACKVAGAKVIVVLGHQSCGAIKGACDNVQLGNLTGMLGKLQPAVAAVQNHSGDRTSANAEFVQKVADENVALSATAIIEGSQVLKEMRDNQEIAIVGGMYDVKTGQVKLIDS